MKYRAAIIGSTGHGNYGHGLDVIFNGHPDITVAALADPDPAGRAAAGGRCHAGRTYADYREMLERERPDLVAVGPRTTGEHHAMVRAALEGNAHVISEKPFMRTLAEADDVLALAATRGRKICVMHQARLSPAILLLKQRMGEGLLGDLLEIRGGVKQDKRIGGEVMLDLGPHLFDLVRFFGGDPRWCSARILQQNHEATWADVHPASEDIGPVVGDNVEAFFALPGGRKVHFTSRAGYDRAAEGYGLDLVGTQGAARILMGFQPAVFIRHRSGSPPGPTRDDWERLPGDPTPPTGLSAGRLEANRRLLDDWLAAIAENREPASSGRTAALAIEMIHAVFAAGMSRTRVPLPLANRQNPLIA